MALAISNSKTSVFGNKRISNFDVAFDSSYPTGGEPLSLSNLGLSEVDIVLISQKSGYMLEYDYTNKKVLAYRSAGFTPAGSVAAPVFTGDALATHTHKQQIATGATAAADSTSGALAKNAAGTETVVRLMGTAISTTYELGESEAKTAGTPAGTNNAPAFTGTAVAAAALIEVANTTDLSALTGVRILAIGV